MDAGPREPSSPWFGSLLRLLVAGIAGLLAYLYGRHDEICFVLGAVAVLVLQVLWDLVPLDAHRQQHHKAAADRANLEECRQRLRPGDVFESWMHEHCMPSENGTQRTLPVLVRLDGAVLSLWSSPAAKVSRKALWSEDRAIGKARASLAGLAQAARRDYPMRGAVVKLLPSDLASVKYWSRKYPICVTVIGEPRVVLDSPPPPAPAPPSTSDPASAPVSPHVSVAAFPPSATVSPSASAQQPGSAAPPAPSLDALHVDDLEDIDEVDEVKNVEDAQDRLLRNIVSEELGLMPDDEDEETTNGEPGGASTLLLFARTARQKEEWFWRLRRAAGEPHPLDDTGLLEDYVSTLLPYLQGGPGPGDDAQPFEGINALAGRVLYDVTRSAQWSRKVQAHLQQRLKSLSIPTYVEPPVVSDVHCRPTCVGLRRADAPRLLTDGLWVDLEVSYRGVLRFVVTTKLVLLDESKPPAHADEIGQQRPSADVPESMPSSDVIPNSDCPAPSTVEPETTAPPSPSWRQRIFKRLTESRFFHGALAALSGTDLVLAVELRALDGVLAVNVPPPPSDRVWFGFRGRPRVTVVAEPSLGGRTVRQAIICRLIEAQIRAHLDRIIVLPNMHNVALPFVSQGYRNV